MAQLLGLLTMVIDAQDGKLSEEEQKSLAGELEGALVGTSRTNATLRMKDRIKGRDWDFIAGRLRTVIDENEIKSAGGVNVNASASSSSVVNVDISFSQMLEIDRIIDRNDDFSNEEKDVLKKLAAEIVDAGKSGDHRSFSDKVAKWLGMTADAVEIWAAFAPILAMLFTALVNQIQIS